MQCRWVFGCAVKSFGTESKHTLLLTEVEDHACENNESKPDTEVWDEVDDGDDDIADGGKDAEQNVTGTQRCVLSQVTWQRTATEVVRAPVLPQQVVDRGGASVDAPQHVSRAPLKVPAQSQTVQMGKQTHLKCEARDTRVTVLMDSSH